MRDRLIEQRQRVAHAAGGGARDQRQRLRLVLDAFRDKHFLQMRNDGRGRHLLQVELQAAAEHGHRDLLRIGGRQDELDVLGRLLERLQHRVEGMAGELVHLVDDVDLEAPARRRVLGRLQQLAHLLDARVGGGIDLQQVDEAAGVDLDAGRALAAGLCRHACFAVEALGKDARQRRLADAARAGEQVGVMQAVLLERVTQCPHDVLLPYQAAEIPRPPLAGKYLIAHRLLNKWRA